MSVTKINANSELTIPRELPAEMHERVKLPDDYESSWEKAPRSILQSTLTALSNGQIVEAVAQFDERFKFNDYALVLEFTEKARLTEFFQKSRELFPESALEVVSLFENGDYAFAEWRLTATQIVPYGSIPYQVRIDLHGSTVIRVEQGKIVQWSDYYDQASSRRNGLASLFEEWIEY